MEHVFQPLVGRSSTIQELHREQRTMALPAARGRPAAGGARAWLWHRWSAPAYGEQAARPKNSES